MGPPGSVELPLAAYRAATLRSVGGVVTSRGIEPRSLGLQPSAMTTLARWSWVWRPRFGRPVIERLGGNEFRLGDEGSLRCGQRDGADAGVEPGPPAYGAGVLPGTPHRRWSRLEDSNPDFPVIGRTSSCWTKPGLVPPAGVEPAWFRLKGGRMAALPRRGTTR